MVLESSFRCIDGKKLWVKRLGWYGLVRVGTGWYGWDGSLPMEPFDPPSPSGAGTSLAIPPRFGDYPNHDGWKCVTPRGVVGGIGISAPHIL